jgi:hypothetical protein
MRLRFIDDPPTASCYAGKIVKQAVFEAFDTTQKLEFLPVALQSTAKNLPSNKYPILIHFKKLTYIKVIASGKK